MNKKAYIHALRENLRGLPAEQKEDIITEIQQHIDDTIAAGKDESEVLRRLGDPKGLAESLAGEYYVENNRLLKAIPFFASKGAAGFFMVFVFGGMALLFGTGAVASVIGGIMRSFGNMDVEMTMFNMQVPQALSIPVSLVTAGLLAGLAFLCYRVLRNYFVRVVSEYKKRMQLLR